MASVISNISDRSFENKEKVKYSAVGYGALSRCLVKCSVVSRRVAM